MAGRESVKVVVRCRPLNKKEIAESRKPIVVIDTAIGSVEITKAGTDDTKRFTFDSVYDDKSTQRDVYDDTGFPLVESVLQGYNGTMFAYGQTGCGKTHTMQGKDSPPELRGIIPTSFEHVFDHLKLLKDKEALVRVSYLELYNEEIRDLLGADHLAKLELKENPEKGVFVKGLRSVVVDGVEAIDALMAQGNAVRTTGSTAMNAESSRSHSIFTIVIEMSGKREDGTEHVTAGKLNLVDLAGSERQSKTKATGARLKEGIKINLSLTALGNVISGLVESSQKHIPYRDSKLTRLLQDSLGGNTKTVMMAAIGPADYNYDETISTLRYANRAKNIKNKPIINEDPKDALLREYKDEIERLKQMLTSQATGAAMVPGAATAAAAAAASSAAAPAAEPARDESLLRDAEAARARAEAVEAQKKQLEEQAMVAQQAAAKNEEARREVEQQLSLQKAAVEEERRARAELAKKLAELEQGLMGQGHTAVKRAVVRKKRPKGAGSAAPSPSSGRAGAASAAAAGGVEGGGSDAEEAGGAGPGSGAGAAAEAASGAGDSLPSRQVMEAKADDGVEEDEYEGEYEEVEEDEAELLARQERELEDARQREAARRAKHKARVARKREARAKAEAAKAELERAAAEEEKLALSEANAAATDLIHKLKAKHAAEVKRLRREVRDAEWELNSTRETMMAQIREQDKEQKLLEQLVAIFLSPDELSKVFERATWSEEDASWGLPAIAYKPGAASSAARRLGRGASPASDGRGFPRLDRGGPASSGGDRAGRGRPRSEAAGNGGGGLPGIGSSRSSQRSPPVVGDDATGWEEPMEDLPSLKTTP
ncbi:hypothetical protein FNF27_06629 [Cafeteria roenbergensis]|uniref:Kinesin-like protein n=1 Tax=Cafeteria roenbergensis TaxID=33653 RepID=A0A5A8DKQ8_CAFRO|nr:hypothetical protein FNF31_01686 [Cafeteria roenbergensis]KAA0166656.1 hypothetical protein FNF28_03030 [Cafeteria roenbergensis]KAA0170372.1 hypothetical protein FNF27_06629 [Cafeteria roenbergensis]